MIYKEETGKDKLGLNRIHCPECGRWSNAELWKERELGCEDCGSHDGLVCPLCEAEFDHVWGFPQLLESSGIKQ